LRTSTEFVNNHLLCALPRAPMTWLKTQTPDARADACALARRASQRGEAEAHPLKTILAAILHGVTDCD